MTDIHDTQALTEGDRLFDQMFTRLMRGDSLQEFGDWFASAAAAPGGPRDDPRAARAMARALWGAVPLPSNHWRARGLPKIERNDPCHCGSGRKYKHCCASLGHVGLPFDAQMLTALAIQHAPPEALDAASVRALPAHALAQAAMFWMEQDQPGQVVAVLGPLFEQGQHLDGRHEPAFDILMEALLALGQQTRRFALARQIAEHRDKALATTARARLVSMLADQGNRAEAWTVFKQAQREAPDDPQLWHLELITLLSEGRVDEARLRGPLLAAKARRAGLDELAHVLAELGEHGLSAIHDRLAHDADEPHATLAHDWLALCTQLPAELDAAAARALYRIDITEPPRRRRATKAMDVTSLDGAMRWLRVRPAPALAALERRWQRSFVVGKPDTVWLDGDADGLLAELPAAAEFLQREPQAWLSVAVLDDLLLAVRELLANDPSPALRQSAWQLSQHALRLLRALLEPAVDGASASAQRLGVAWSHTPSRPLLRLLAQAISFGLDQQREVLPLLEWSVALNPQDNHGWRAMLADAWIAADRHADALALLERYPDDFPPARHRRALALHALGRHDEAAAELARAHAEYPAYLNALWPDVLDAPPPEDGPGLSLGSEQAAYEYRAEARAEWVRTGALAWSQTLALPAPRKRRAAPRKAAAKRPAGDGNASLLAGGTDLAALALPAAPRRHLQTHYDWPRLHGYLTAIAWSPGMVMPAAWLPAALGWRTQPPPGTPAAQQKAINTDLDALMRLYNSLNAHLINARPAAPMPLDLTRELADADGHTADDAALLAWCAGFMQGAEQSAADWRRAGRPLKARPAKAGASLDTTAFATLYALAARASREPGADAAHWQATQDDGQPLLVGLQAAGALPVADQLRLALADLWQVTLPLRLARMAGSASGKRIQLSSLSIDPGDMP